MKVKMFSKFFISLFLVGTVFIGCNNGLADARNNILNEVLKQEELDYPSRDEYLKLVEDENGLAIILGNDINFNGNDIDVRYEDSSIYYRVVIPNEPNKKVYLPFVNADEKVHIQLEGAFEKNYKDMRWQSRNYQINTTKNSKNNFFDFVPGYEDYKKITLTIDRNGYKFNTKIHTNGKTLKDFFNLNRMSDVSAEYNFIAGKLYWKDSDWGGGNNFEFDRENKTIKAFNNNRRWEDIFVSGIDARWVSEEELRERIKKHQNKYCSNFRLKFKIYDFDYWIRFDEQYSPEYDDNETLNKYLNLEESLVNAVADVENTPSSQEEMVQFFNEIIAEITGKNSLNNSSRMVQPSITAVTDYSYISSVITSIPSEIKRIYENIESGDGRINFNKALNVGEISVNDWFSLIYNLNDEINNVFNNGSYEGSSNNVFFGNNPKQEEYIRNILGIVEKYATIKQFYVDADVNADVSSLMNEDLISSDDTICSAKLKALLSAGSIDFDSLVNEIYKFVIGNQEDDSIITQMPLKAFSFDYGIDCNANITASDYNKIRNFDSSISSNTDFNYELEALVKMAIVSSSKKGGIFVINPKITLTVEDIVELIKISSNKKATFADYLNLLNKVLYIKFSVQDKNGSVQYSRGLSMNDIIEYLPGIEQKPEEVAPLCTINYQNNYGTVELKVDHSWTEVEFIFETGIEDKIQLVYLDAEINPDDQWGNPYAGYSGALKESEINVVISDATERINNPGTKTLDKIGIQNYNGAANGIPVVVKSITATKDDGTNVEITKDMLSIAFWAGNIE